MITAFFLPFLFKEQCFFHLEIIIAFFLIIWRINYYCFVYYLLLVFLAIQVLESLQYLNPFLNKPWFLCVCNTSLLNTLWEKEKLLRAVSPFPNSVYYPFGELSAIFIKFEIVICWLYPVSVHTQDDSIWNLTKSRPFRLVKAILL